MTDVLLVDYNGVVVNDEPLHYAAFRAVLQDNGLDVDERTYYRDYLGMDDRSAFVEAWRRAQRTITGELLRVLVEEKSQRYGRLTAAGVPAVAGAADFLRGAAQRWPLAVVSGAVRREITTGLEQLKLTDVVSAIVALEDTPTGKPDPAGLHLALRQLAAMGDRPRRAVVLEDSQPGIDAARAIGAGCVILATSQGIAPAGADAVWDDFTGHDPAELAPLLKPLRG